MAFGEELRSRRQQAGLSLAELAALVYFHKSTLSKVENGHQAPSQALARACDGALNAGGALTALVTRPRGLPAVSPPAVGAWPAVGWFGPASPERWLGHGAQGYAATHPGPAAAAATVAILPVLSASFEQLRLLGHQMPAGPVLGQVGELTSWTRALAEHAPDPRLAVRFGLLAARFAEYAGWMAQELGEDRAAVEWTRLAVSWAVAAGDAELSWFALVRAADIALYQDDPERMIEVGRQAQQAAPPRVGSLAAQREAQGHAILGDYEACMRALDRAAELAAGGDTPGGKWDGAWGGAAAVGGGSVTDPLAVVTGWALVDLGRPAEAATILDREVPRIAAVATRARARYGLRQVLAHAATGNLDLACDLLVPLIPDIARCDSATIKVDLKRVRNELARWRGHPAVADLWPLLSSVLHGSSGRV